MIPLYGHTSRETAYLVSDYPYGRLTCNNWFWIESDPKKGYRTINQTENPKTKKLNIPKKSIYSKLASCLYLDEKGHVKSFSLTEYDSHERVSEFVRTFTKADLSVIKYWAGLKARMYNSSLTSGKEVISINGVAKDLSEPERERVQEQANAWARINLACQAREKLELSKFLDK